MFINKVRNSFKKHIPIVTKESLLFNYNTPYKLFSSKTSKIDLNNNKQEENITLETNVNEENELLIKIPPHLSQNYTLGQLSFFMLYENYTTLNKLTKFIPAPKTNILIFSYLTYMSYASNMFQPSLCILFYMINKINLCNNRINSEILSISILPNMSTILVRTVANTFSLEMGDISMDTDIKIGSDIYNVIKVNSNTNLYFKVNGTRYVHNELVMTLLSGKYTNAKFVYL